MDVLLYGYLGGWVLTSIVACLLAWRLQDGHSRAPHPILMSLLAGAAWPVFVFAIAEVGAVALTSEYRRDDEYLQTIGV